MAHLSLGKKTFNAAESRPASASACSSVIAPSSGIPSFAHWARAEERAIVSPM
jgi:hypothetical protein